MPPPSPPGRDGIVTPGRAGIVTAGPAGDGIHGALAGVPGGGVGQMTSVPRRVGVSRRVGERGPVGVI